MSRTSKLEFTEINIDDLASAMVEAAKDYTDEIIESVHSGINEITYETLSEVKKLSPVYKGDHVRSVAKFGSKALSGAYRRRWYIDSLKRRGVYKTVIHNKQYQLVHLLELGHCLKDGTGRVCGNVSAFPHVEIAEKHAEEKINKLLEDL